MARNKFEVGQKVVVKGGKNHGRVTTVTDVRYVDQIKTEKPSDKWWYKLNPTAGNSGRYFPESRLSPYDPPKDEGHEEKEDTNKIVSWDDCPWQPDTVKEDTPSEEIELVDL